MHLGVHVHTAFEVNAETGYEIFIMTSSRLCQIEDEGRYTCQANNEAGQEKKSFKLKVLSKRNAFFCKLPRGFVLQALIVAIRKRNISRDYKTYWCLCLCLVQFRL